MLKHRSPNSLYAVTFVILNTLATWAIVVAVGEGDQIRFMTDNYVYSLAVLGLSFSFVHFLLPTWFCPAEFDPWVTVITRAFRIVLCICIFAVLISAVGLSAVIGIGSEDVLSKYVLVACYYIVRLGIYISFLTILVGGIIGIALDVSMLAKRFGGFRTTR